MFQGIDVSIEWINTHLLSSGGIAGIISSVALIVMAIRLKKLEKISIVLIQHERTMEENTDAQIATARELKAMRHKVGVVSSHWEQKVEKEKNGNDNTFPKL